MKSTTDNIQTGMLRLDMNGLSCQTSYFVREGGDKTLLFLHGLGCSKDDFTSAAEYDELKSYRLAGLDFPGHGNSPYTIRNPLNVDHLVELTFQFIKILELRNVILVGHSLGGLVALLLIRKAEIEFSGFINAEGNLAPEDCMFTRTVVKYSREEYIEKQFPLLKKRMQNGEKAGPRQFLKNLNRCNPSAFYDYSPSTVEYSEGGNLLSQFIALDLPRQFILGEENAGLSYLPRILKSSIKVDIVPGGTHFMYADSPGFFYRAVAQFAEGLT